MQKFKFFTVILIYFLLMFYISEQNTIVAMKNGFMSEEEAIIRMLNAVGGYWSVKSFNLFYGISFVFLLYYYIQKEQAYILVRYYSKTNYFLLRIKKCFTLSIIFSTVHVCVGVITMYLFFSNELLKNNDFILLNGMQVIIEIVYFMIIGMYFYIIKDKSNKLLVSFIIVLLTYAVVFFINNLTNEQYYIGYLDPSIGVRIIQGEISINMAKSIIVGDVGIMMIVLGVAYFIYLRKDWY